MVGSIKTMNALLAHVMDVNQTRVTLEIDKAVQALQEQGVEINRHVQSLEVDHRYLSQEQGGDTKTGLKPYRHRLQRSGKLYYGAAAVKQWGQGHKPRLHQSQWDLRWFSMITILSLKSVRQPTVWMQVTVGVLQQETRWGNARWKGNTPAAAEHHPKRKQNESAENMVE
ncbi:hypothetical protein JB92DRAFT_2829714 [Gautieria morchelliformis]|nr:hypothetical protein JB92DRAFT_2829714 [Gautieria morchelliformis]